MPLQPNVVERQILKAGVAPALVVDFLMPLNQACALLAAAETGVLTELANGPADSPTLAARTGSSERGVEVLLTTLGALGYVVRRNGAFELTRMARRSLPLDELSAMAPFLRETVARLADAGGGVRELAAGGLIGWEVLHEGDVARAYQSFMRSTAAGIAPYVAKAVDVSPTAKRLLDVGGAHALYSVALCRKYERLHATILDWPEGIASAKRTVAASGGLASRVDFVERDFEQDELPDGYDVVFLGNIVHGLSPESNRGLFAKAAHATGSGGSLVILDQFAHARGTAFARGIAALFGLNLYLSVAGEAYPYEDVARWLTEAGFGLTSQKPLRRMPGVSLVTGRKA